LPRVFCIGDFNPQTAECQIESEPAAIQPRVRPSLSRVLKICIICLVLWAIPVGGIWIALGYNGALTQVGLFFTKAAFVNFGGAYAVLSYVTEVAVSRSWLSTQQMLIGLGLAESTPGPLIMVTHYADFLAAWNLPGGFDPLTAARHRWNIETEILVEKLYGYNYEHCFSYSWNAMKGYHYWKRFLFYADFKSYASLNQQET
jgi:chromate transporter